MKSLAQKLEQVEGLTGTKDLTEWENEFVKSVYTRYTTANSDTRALTPKQVEVIERIYTKHFA